MISPIDTYRAANIVIKQYGDQAAEYALRRIRALEGMNAFEGADVWREILKAIAGLQSTRPEQASH